MGSLKVAYSRNGDKMFCLNANYMKDILLSCQKNPWKAREQITEPAYIAKSFENTELENIKSSTTRGRITGEQAPPL